MQDLSQRCIFSGSSENLNTIMTVTLDGEKYKVAVSDEHEDDASPGAIKRLIPERLAAKEAARAEMLSKMEEFKALASELGFDLVKKGEKPALTPQAKENPLDKSTLRQQKNTRPDTDLSKEEIMAAREAAKRAESPLQVTHTAAGIAAAVSPHIIPQHVEVQTTEGTKIVEKPRIINETQQMVKGPGGVPIPIPRNIKGTDGETTITITGGINDKIIQQRGKQLHMMRENNDASFYNSDCRQCKGKGIIENRRGEQKQCRTCGGAGIVI
jgi:hypothetical protein